MTSTVVTTLRETVKEVAVIIRENAQLQAKVNKLQAKLDKLQGNAPAAKAEKPAARRGRKAKVEAPVKAEKKVVAKAPAVSDDFEL